jgi:hypothetical protein
LWGSGGASLTGFSRDTHAWDRLPAGTPEDSDMQDLSSPTGRASLPALGSRPARPAEECGARACSSRAEAGGGGLDDPNPLPFLAMLIRPNGTATSQAGRAHSAKGPPGDLRLGRTKQFEAPARATGSEVTRARSDSQEQDSDWPRIPDRPAHRLLFTAWPRIRCMSIHFFLSLPAKLFRSSWQHHPFIRGDRVSVLVFVFVFPWPVT